jgi:hypothetical protein
MPSSVIVIPFGPYEPDSADLNAPVLLTAEGVLPSKKAATSPPRLKPLSHQDGTLRTARARA